MDEKPMHPDVAAQYIRAVCGNASFRAGIILGSGLSDVAARIEDKTVIPYEDIPGFGKCTAEGHEGNFLAGTLGGRRVCVMQGRFHHYEGYDMGQVTLPVRVMRLLGVECLLVSNASGALNGSLRPGDLMLITDHINMLPNPLVGANDDRFGPRFPDMLNAYDPELIALAAKLACDRGVDIKKGVYLAVSGPSYETQAEYDFFKLIGADAVGMSTVPEVIVARHAGMRVLGVSVISSAPHDNASSQALDSDAVLRAAGEASSKVADLFTGIIENIF